MFSWEVPNLNGKKRAETGTHYSRGKRQLGETPTLHWYHLQSPIESKHDSPVYSQRRPLPINLKDDLTVELALMQRYAITTTLRFSDKTCSL